MSEDKIYCWYCKEEILNKDDALKRKVNKDYQYAHKECQGTSEKLMANNSNKNTSNLIGRIIVVIGYAIFICGFIAGIMFGQSEDQFLWRNAFIWWMSSFLSGIMFLGFAEVIKLLDNINHKLDKEI